ncbi:MAG: T9SS type A sorting domain-containing protein [Bacteroidetes bacterium]|nr:T9SS type A sorting domain-containing protein [Bacteroidota bacterium]
MNKKLVVLFSLLLLAGISHAQMYFNRTMNIPVVNGSQLQMPWAGGLNYPLFSNIDLNDDGLIDLFAFDRSDNRVTTYINTGTSGSNCWRYAPEYENIFPKMTGWAFLYDYNCDEKPDLFTVGFRNNSISQYINDSPPGGLHFTLIDSTMLVDGGAGGPANIFASALLMPNFNDIDGDGDMDIIGQQFQCVGAFAYYKNMSMEHHGVCDTLNDYVIETYAWGKFALRSGAYADVTVGFFNINCFSNPNDNYDMSVAAPMDDTYANIATIDIDGDGDMDALIGDSQTKNSLLVVNAPASGTDFMVSQDTAFPSYNVPVNIQSFAMHSYVDVDNDQIRDLVVSNYEYENNNGTIYYHNTGTDSQPIFDYIKRNFLTDQMIDVGEAAAPALFDYDNDGLLDLVIANKKKTITPSTYSTGLALYRNTGTATIPSFEFVTDDYLNLISQNYMGKLSPAFGDLDADGDKDLLIGIDSGELIYYRNDGGSFVFITAMYMSIDVGNGASVQIFDVNQDGKLDLLTGEKNGSLSYFENVGSATIPFFTVTPTISLFSGFSFNVAPSTDSYSTTYIFRQNNDTKMLVTTMSGDIYLLGNIDGNLSGTFTVLDTVVSKYLGNRYGPHTSICGGDLNNDQKDDIIVGLYGGGVQVFYQDIVNSTFESSSDKEISVYPNPATENLIVKLRSGSLNTKCLMYDLHGRKVDEKLLIDGYTVFNTSKLASGIYFIHIRTGESDVVKKVVITQSN